MTTLAGRRREALTESKAALIRLSEEQASALNKIGSQLASDKHWWGQSESDERGSVISCRPESSGFWSVRVDNAIGLIAVGDLQITVEPKIPIEHLLFLFSVSGRIPRVQPQTGELGVGVSLFAVIARWFVIAVEALFRRDIIRDYREEEDILSTVQGRIHVVPTARRVLTGHSDAMCTYEDYSFDTPINRILRGAGEIIARTSLAGDETRRRARGIVARLQDAGPLQPTDLLIEIDRRSGYYRDSLCWAREILLARGRSLATGSLSSWTFLIRTPEAVEAALRQLMAGQLGKKRVPDAGRRRHLKGSSLTFTPDIVIDEGVAVADVKYKIRSDDWQRGDLYQIIAFSAIFQSRFAAIIDFCSEMAQSPATVQVNELQIRRVAWPSIAELRPQLAADVFLNRVNQWVSSISEMEASAHSA